MGEKLYLPADFPTVNELEQATMKAIKAADGIVTTKQIKEFVVVELKLSDEVLKVEHTDGLTLLIDYRLRWARTSLKNQGKIKNVARGQWSLA